MYKYMTPPEITCKDNLFFKKSWWTLILKFRLVKYDTLFTEI